jgi:hypothetical protein
LNCSLAAIFILPAAPVPHSKRPVVRAVYLWFAEQLFYHHQQGQNKETELVWYNVLYCATSGIAITNFFSWHSCKRSTTIPELGFKRIFYALNYWFVENSFIFPFPMPTTKSRLSPFLNYFFDGATLKSKVPTAPNYLVFPPGNALL